jgi:hypothetical protein
MNPLQVLFLDLPFAIRFAFFVAVLYGSARLQPRFDESVGLFASAYVFAIIFTTTASLVPFLFVAICYQCMFAVYDLVSEFVSRRIRDADPR